MLLGGCLYGNLILKSDSFHDCSMDGIDRHGEREIDGHTAICVMQRAMHPPSMTFSGILCARWMVGCVRLGAALVTSAEGQKID